MILSTEQFEFLLQSSPSSSSIPNSFSGELGSEARLMNPGALSTLMRSLEDLRTDVVAWIIAFVRSAAFSEAAKQVVVYEENKSVLTTMV